MSRPLHVFEPIPGTDVDVATRFVDAPEGWLPPPAWPTGPGRWWVELTAAGLRRRVVCTAGPAWRVGSTIWRSTSWVPEPLEGDLARPDRWLPTLHAEIGLRRDDAGDSLILSGHYDVPASRAGELLDLVLLHRIARGTASAFLVAIARRLADPPTRDGSAQHVAGIGHVSVQSRTGDPNGPTAACS